MRVRVRVVGWMVIVVAVLAACGGGATDMPKGVTPPAEQPTQQPTIAGTWIGSTPVGNPAFQGSTQTLAVTLVNTNGALSGTGSLLTAGSPGQWDPLTLAITGTYVAPNVTLTMTGNDRSTTTFTGALSSTGVTGVMSGAARFTNASFTLQNPSATSGVGTLAIVGIDGADSLEAGWSIPLFAWTKDRVGNYLSIPVTWSSNATSVATINSFGFVDGIAAGTTTITATAAQSGVTAKADRRFTVTLPYWVATWRMYDYDLRTLPVTITAQGVTTRIVAKTLVMRADKTGTWTDSTLSSAACPSGTPVGTLCNASSRANITWSSFLSEVTVKAVPGTIVGSIPTQRVFQKLFDTDLLSQSGITERYTKR